MASKHTVGNKPSAKVLPDLSENMLHNSRLKIMCRFSGRVANPIRRHKIISSRHHIPTLETVIYPAIVNSIWVCLSLSDAIWIEDHKQSGMPDKVRAMDVVDVNMRKLRSNG